MSKNILKAAIDEAIDALPVVGTNKVKYRSPLDLIDTFDRRSKLAALRSLAGAVQFTMINTCDWIVRREDGNVASTSPTLDERNTADEFARGEEHVNYVADQFGTEALQSPEEKLKQYSHLYYGLVDTIRTLAPAPFERPKPLLETLDNFVPRPVGLSAETMKLLEAAESEPGEFLKARDDNKKLKTADLETRKPRIKQLLDLNADCMPMTEVFEELPRHTQLRMATAMWKGIYYSRKSLVTYIGTYNKLEELAGVTMMAKDLEILSDWCEEYEQDNDDLFTVMIEAGVNVYGIGDAKADVKKPRV